mgnify:FL=1
MNYRVATKAWVVARGESGHCPFVLKPCYDLGVGTNVCVFLLFERKVFGGPVFSKYWVVHRGKQNYKVKMLFQSQMFSRRTSTLTQLLVMEVKIHTDMNAFAERW